jgi:N-acetylmuramoyl-L-alanine amidase
MRCFDLPYFDERNAKIDMIVIHCLSHSVQSAIDTFHHHRVSAHYLIDEKGKIYSLVAEHKRAWHAGQSFWQNRKGLNDNSIGIELCSPSLGQTSYPMHQISALIRLCQKLKHKYHIKKENILGHSDIAPTRKPDPGKAFPWAYLARHGLGIWYNKKNAAQVKLNSYEELLKQIGYDTSNLSAATFAFMRRFIPEFIPDEKIENLLTKPYPDTIDADQALLLQVLKAVFFQIRKSFFHNNHILK